MDIIIVEISLKTRLLSIQKQENLFEMRCERNFTAPMRGSGSSTGNGGGIPIGILPYGDDATPCHGELKAYMERQGTPIDALDMLIDARLRHIAGTRWGTRCYLNMALLREMKREEDAA